MMSIVDPIAQKDAELDRLILDLYASELDLHRMPQAVFAAMTASVAADMVAYSEFHPGSGEFRAEFSHPDPDVERRARTTAAFMKHMGCHPFWGADPAYFGTRALRESDFFSDEEYMALPIAREVYLPANAHREMKVMIVQDGYAVSISTHRVVGRPAYSDAERDRMQTLRGHVARIYAQALERTVTSLPLTQRIGYICPELTPRQRDVAELLAAGKSNELIAQLLGVGVETVKSHVRMVLDKLGVEDRFSAGLALHQRPPFARMPPLWTLPGSRWSPRGETHVPAPEARGSAAT